LILLPQRSLHGLSGWVELTNTLHNLTEDRPRSWIQGHGVNARAWHCVLDFLESRNILFGTAQNYLLAAIITIRSLLGERPLNSIFLLFVLTSRVITIVISDDTFSNSLRMQLVSVAALLRRYSPSPHPLLKLLSHVSALPSSN
jgi:hypothetical protein